MSDIDFSYQLQLLSYSICKVVCISVLKNLYKKKYHIVIFLQPVTFTPQHIT